MELTSFLLALEPTPQVLHQEPLIPLAILATVILLVPILGDRLGIPRSLGFVLAGIILNPTGLNLLNDKLPAMEPLANASLFYLMLVAGLELDWEKWSRIKVKAIRWGGLNLLISLAIGWGWGVISGLGVSVGLIVGLLYASYTAIVYPIVQNLGVANNRAIATAIGSKLVSDAIAVLLVAFCVSIFRYQLNVAQSISLFGWLIIYTTVILVGFDWAGREFFGRSGEDEGNQYLFVCVAAFLAAVSAQWMHIDIIFGAFIAGLAVNNILCDGPVKQRIILIGDCGFLPLFLIYVGLLIKTPQFIVHIFNWQFLAFLTTILFVNKLLIALSGKTLEAYNWRETLTVWSLFLPQINLTLVLALVCWRQQIISGVIFDYAVATMLIGSTLAVVMAPRTARQLSAPANFSAPSTQTSFPIAQQLPTIIVPVYNPQTQQHLIEMAILLGKQAQSRIVPLAIAKASANMDSPRLVSSLQRSQRLLERAEAIANFLGATAEPRLRIDDAFAQGISRVAKEENASLIIIGWGKNTGIRARLFGNVIDNVLWASHCPVAVTRLIESPSKIQRILVPIENISEPAIQPILFAQLIAQSNQAQVTLLHVCQRRTSDRHINHRRQQINEFVQELQLVNPPEVQIIAHESITQAILQAARLYDLVVFPFSRKYGVSGSIAIGDITNQVARQISCSVIMLGEPQRGDYVPLVPTTTTNRPATV